MPAGALTAALADLLDGVRRPGDFFAAGTTELLAPSLEVEGVGRIALPLLPAQARALVAVAEQAPYGRGPATLVDPAVRRCWQIGPDRVRIGGRHWARTLEMILGQVCEGLGVELPIGAELYKLLVYDEGSFFVGHRDTEKSPGMFATLLVVLPSEFSGGDLMVRHKGREARIDLHGDDPAEARFAAFYADCVHEVLPITGGFRLTLVYNLVRGGRGNPPEPPDYADQQTRIAALLRQWPDAVPDDGDSPDPDEGDDEHAAPEKLVFLLDHAYTPAELDFAALKGADAAAAGVLVAAARDARCDVHLALLTVREDGSATYVDRYESHRRRWDDDGEDDEYEADEVMNREVGLSDWRHPEGGTPFEIELPVADWEIAPPGACGELTPDEEHFHEATGNAGASFERTYRRAALVLWPSARISAVLCQAGLPVTLPHLDALTAQWVAAGADRGSPIWYQARDLAAHMLDRWPSRAWFEPEGAAPTEAGRMLVALARLGDAEEIERLLLEVVAEGRIGIGDSAAIVAALEHVPQARAEAAVEAVIEGAAPTALAACASLLAKLAAAWPRQRMIRLAGAATRLIAALPGDPARRPDDPPWRRRPGVQPGTIVDLLGGLGVIGDALAVRAAEHCLAWPAVYPPDAVLIPAARKLVDSRSVAAVGRLLTVCVAHLRARIAEPLAAPADWRRAADLACRCQHCIRLARYLDDPQQREWIFKAAEPDRAHVETTIKRAECDLDFRTDKRGRPYSLICAKNQARFERRAAQRARDLADLALLAG